VSAGTLAISSAERIVNTSALSIATGATFDLTNGGAGNFSETVGSLAGAAGGNVILGSATLTVGGDNSSTSFAGILTGTGGLTKIGTGTQALTGASVYLGLTAINAGVLAADTLADVGAANSALGAPTTMANGTIALGSGTSTGTLR